MEKNRLECYQVISRVSEKARTDAGAKAAIAECRRLPTMSKATCEKEQVSWAAHMRRTGGREWNYPDRHLKQDCRTYYPGTFSPSLWVTVSTCQEFAARLASTPSDFTAGETYSKRYHQLVLQSAMDNYPLHGLEGWHAIERIRKRELPDSPLAEVAAELGMDAPPDRPAVYALCKSMQAR